MLVETKCLKCGKTVQHDDSRIFIFCPFCGSKADDSSSDSQGQGRIKTGTDNVDHQNPNIGTRYDVFGGSYGSFFGGRSSTANKLRPQNGKDIKRRLEVSLQEAVSGTTKVISINKENNCNACNGSGFRDGTSSITCPVCNGIGIVEQPTQTLFGKTIVRKVCSSCNRRGTIINKPCSKCRGKGRLKMLKDLPVVIPPGVRTGTVLSLNGEGELGKNGGDDGTLLIEIVVV